MSKYKVVPMDEKTWRIEEENPLCSVYMYLLAGEKEALLIDAGYGKIPLDEIVASLTSLPVRVILTHGHFDHVGGTGRFERVWLHPADAEMYGNYAVSLARQKREDMAKEQSGAETGPQKIEPWLNETVTLLNVEEPLDLGGRRLKLIHVPGHSGGCICILDEERGWLFTGDTCCEGDVLLNLQYSQKADVYLESLKKLEQEKFSVTWPAHHRVPVEPEIIQEFEEAAQLLCGKQAEGECVDTSFGPSRRLKHKRIGILYKDET